MANEVSEKKTTDPVRRHNHGKGGRGDRRHGRKPQASLKPGSFQYVWRSVSHDKGAMIGMILMLIIIVL